MPKFRPLHPLRQRPLLPVDRRLPKPSRKATTSRADVSTIPSGRHARAGGKRKTLVAILSMHRSGSSVTTNVLQALGMSLGPFELLGATPFNKYGHFEPEPLVALDREIHREAHGYADEEVYHAPDLMRRLERTRGQWRGRRVRKEWLERGREILDELIASGEVAGFKDPRVPLIWPFWRRLIAERTDVRTVLLFLVRSPHEVAMSVFMRSAGEIPYDRALTACSAHLRQMHRIQQAWTGESALVRFGTPHYFDDLKAATTLCGLEWSEKIAAGVVDPHERHHRAAYVAHPAQRLYERLGGEVGNLSSNRNLRILQEDAATREALLRARAHDARREAKQALIERTRVESLEARQPSTNDAVAPIPQGKLAGNLSRRSESEIRASTAAFEAATTQRLETMNEELTAIRQSIEALQSGTSGRKRRRHSSHIVRDENPT